MTDITREEVEAHDIPDEMVKAAAEEMMGHVNAPTGAIYKAARLALAAALRAFAKSMDAEPVTAHTEPPKGLVRIHHDGFEGDVIGSYVTREGKRGVVLQQVGTRIVHVYGEKWLAASPQPQPTERVSG